jgi:hypothetical protein
MAEDETVAPPPLLVEVARLVGLGYTMDEVARIFGIRKGPQREAFVRQYMPNDVVYPMSYPPGSVLYLGSKEDPDGRKTTAFLVKEGGWSDEERQEAVRQFNEGKLFSRNQTVRPPHTEEMRDDHDGPIHPDLHLPSGWNDG